MGGELKEALNIAELKSYVWKFARKDQVQEEIKLMDATPEQLQSFYKHCISMLHNEDKLNPGRYVLLSQIKEQRRKCNIELFLRGLESGALCADKKPYPRYLYLQDMRDHMNRYKSDFPAEELNKISISVYAGRLPREFERITISEVLDGCLDQLGFFENKHITFTFILSLGVHLTPAEKKELEETDKDGNIRNKPEVIKERLNLKSHIGLAIKSTGLNFKELRAMLNLRPVKYSELTTDQLTTLRNKVLFRLENKVQYHIKQWEQRLSQLKAVAEAREITLK